MATFMGMRGTGDWTDADARPKSWREVVLKLYPNGKAPLTAILSKMQKEKVTDPEFKWWTETFQNQGGAVTGCFKSSDLSTGTGLSAVVDGTLLYVQATAAIIGHFRTGHQAVLRNTSDYSEDCVGKIMEVVANGASSYVVFKALQASAADPDDDFDRMIVIGSINPEGGAMPDGIAYDPVKWSNYTQIFRDPLSMTRTAMETKIRYGNEYQRRKLGTLEAHSIGMEKAFLFGYPTEKTGANGKPERTTMGIFNAIRGIAHTTYAGYPATYTDYNGTVSHFPTAHTALTWMNGGEAWLDTQLAAIFAYGDGEKMCLCGNTVLLGLMRLAKNLGTWNFTPETTAYGIKVVTWVTTFGTINFVSHPLFNLESSLSGTALIFEPRNIKFRYVRDTTFYAEGDTQNTGAGRIDGISEEYLTEAGLEFHHPIGWGILTGFNEDGAGS